MLSQTSPDAAGPAEAMHLEAPGGERRGVRRLRTLKQGKIVTSDWTMFDCLIRDMSDNGARIALGGLAELPSEFRLLIVSSNVLIPVELEWRRSLLAGLRFTGPAQTAPPKAF